MGVPKQDPLMSGIFWSGPPAKILQAWHDKKISLVLSPEILEEYKRVGSILSQKYPVINIEPIIDLIVIHSEMCSANKLNKQISNDPDDDKFIGSVAKNWMQGYDLCFCKRVFRNDELQAATF